MLAAAATSKKVPAEVQCIALVLPAVIAAELSASEYSPVSKSPIKEYPARLFDPSPACIYVLLVEYILLLAPI